MNCKGNRMSTIINESDLTLYVQSKVVKRLHFIETANGKWRILVELTTQKGALLDLVTMRKTRREWASLDRLIRHLHEKNLVVPDISLTLHSGATHEDSDQNHP